MGNEVARFRKKQGKDLKADWSLQAVDLVVVDACWEGGGKIVDGCSGERVKLVVKGVVKMRKMARACLLGAAEG